MPKMSELKNPESKLAMENRDDDKMKEEMYRDESNDATFKGAGKDEEEDAPEDLDILSTLEKSTAAKKRKNDLDAENLINLATKGLSDSIKKQEMDRITECMASRKRARMTLQRSLVSVVTQMESDSAAVKECNHQLQQMLRSQQKLALRIEASHRERIQSLRDINETYSKMVEGLLSKGALKPDDRPIWYDVYRAFPPLVEPKYARPKPAKEPIRQIFYPEDQQRASFHALGHGLGAVNMLSPTGETHIKKLLRSYEQLKSDDLPEDKLIEQCVVSVEGDRRQAATKVAALSPQSVTSQVMAEADIKNIFKDN